MARNQFTYDLWLVRSNAVYKAVPYDVVTDWLLQGRITGDDQAKPIGTPKFAPIHTITALAPYILRPAEDAVEDRVEALEPIEAEVQWKRSGEDDDDDVDMIPLIDISLVLLIFFMMTATVTAVTSAIDVPPSPHAHALTTSPDVLTINVDRFADQRARFGINLGDQAAKPEDSNLDETAFFARLDALLKSADTAMEVRIAADKALPGELVMNLSVELEKRRHGGKAIRDIKAEVSDK
jgi:biopolymer transport protein ExbD